MPRCVDQLFSRIAAYLRKHNAYDRQGILDAIESGFKNVEDYPQPPVLKNLDRAANISEWVEPYLAPTPNVTVFDNSKSKRLKIRYASLLETDARMMQTRTHGKI